MFAPEAVKVVDVPPQTVALFDEEITGTDFTVTAIDFVDEQPLLVPVTTYVVVFDGVAMTVLPVATLRPDVGLQL